MALIGLGFRALSMAPTSIGPVKAMLLKLDSGAAREFLDRELARAGGAESLRLQLISFAERHNIPV
jgi:phosphotransferase system enzyme I (PtsP)